MQKCDYFKWRLFGQPGDPAFVSQSMDHFDDIGPSVVMASPGMIQNGLSRELFESWCTDKRNGVIIAGYCVEGTLAKVSHHLGVPGDGSPSMLAEVCSGSVHLNVGLLA